MNLLFIILAAVSIAVFILAIYACVRIAAENDSPPPTPPTPPDKKDNRRATTEENDAKAEYYKARTEYYKNLWQVIYQRVKATLAENGENLGREIYNADKNDFRPGSVNSLYSTLLFDLDKGGLFDLIAFADEYGVSIDYLLGRKETSWVQ